MNEKVLFVDDEPNVLAGYERQLRKRFTTETATSGEAGLTALGTRGPFGVVVSDMRMPGMDGAQFLARVRARHPDVVRILLTGFADVTSAIAAVNQGNIFRFLTKPCPADTLATALDDGLSQYRLVVAERELLDKTLRGSVHVLGEVLGLVNPTAFGRAIRVQQLVKSLAELVEGAGNWEVDVATILSQLGWISVPEPVLAAAARGADLTPEERHQMESYTGFARDLLRPIPRLERVLEIIAYQDKPFGGSDQPLADRVGKDLPLGSRVLKVAFDFDTLVARGVPRLQSLAQLQSRTGAYDPDILAALDTLIHRESQPECQDLPVSQVVCGMILAEDIFSDAGVLLLSKGYQITEAVKRRLEVIAAHGRTTRRIRVLVPRGLRTS